MIHAKLIAQENYNPKYAGTLDTFRYQLEKYYFGDMWEEDLGKFNNLQPGDFVRVSFMLPYGFRECKRVYERPTVFKFEDFERPEDIETQFANKEV